MKRSRTNWREVAFTTVCRRVSKGKGVGDAWLVYTELLQLAREVSKRREKPATMPSLNDIREMYEKVGRPAGPRLVV
jgi:hypothetical protein